MPLFQIMHGREKIITDLSWTIPQKPTQLNWYNAYLEVDFQLVTLADSNVGIVAGPNNGNQDATTTNGNTFIKEIQVECNGTSVYTNMKANEATNALTLLKYTKSYADSVGKDQFFYVDTSTGTTEGRPAQALL